MISEIQNGESGASVRAKLNQAIGAINASSSFESLLFGDTPPTTRRDGSPLQIGDRIFLENGKTGFYTGLLWLSDKDFRVLCGPDASILLPAFQNNLNSASGHGEIRQNLFCTKAGLSGLVSPAHNTSNYYRIRWQKVNFVSLTLICDFNTSQLQEGYFDFELAVNAAIGSLNGWACTVDRIGEPSFIRAQSYLICKEIL